MLAGSTVSIVCSFRISFFSIRIKQDLITQHGFLRKMYRHFSVCRSSQSFIDHDRIACIIDVLVFIQIIFCHMIQHLRIISLFRHPPDLFDPRIKRFVIDAFTRHLDIRALRTPRFEIEDTPLAGRCRNHISILIPQIIIPIKQDPFFRTRISSQMI